MGSALADCLGLPGQRQLGLGTAPRIAIIEEGSGRCTRLHHSAHPVEVGVRMLCGGSTVTISKSWRRPSRAVQEIDRFDDSPIKAAPIGVITDTFVGLPSCLCHAGGGIGVVLEVAGHVHEGAERRIALLQGIGNTPGSYEWGSACQPDRKGGILRPSRMATESSSPSNRIPSLVKRMAFPSQPVQSEKFPPHRCN